MRCVVGLDLASRTGFAVFKDGVLAEHGALAVDVTKFGPYPMNIVRAAKQLAFDIGAMLDSATEGLAIGDISVVVEDSNKCFKSSRHTQKVLEFIHMAVLARLLEHGYRVQYVDTGAWRAKLGIGLSGADRARNAAIAAQKRQEEPLIKAKVKEMIDRKFQPLVSALRLGDEAGAAKLKRQAADEAKQLTRYFKGQSKARGKRSLKHVAVEYVNARFGKGFRPEQNDIAEAILIAFATLPGAVQSTMQQPTEEADNVLGGNHMQVLRQLPGAGAEEPAPR